MTEKRFVAIGVEWTDGFIQDHREDKDLFNVGAVCNLLNELNNENKQLKSINQDHKDHLADFYADYDRLEKENEQLKQFKENVIKWVDSQMKFNAKKYIETEDPHFKSENIDLHNFKVFIGIDSND